MKERPIHFDHLEGCCGDIPAFGELSIFSKGVVFRAAVTPLLSMPMASVPSATSPNSYSLDSVFGTPILQTLVLLSLSLRSQASKQLIGSKLERKELPVATS